LIVARTLSRPWGAEATGCVDCAGRAVAGTVVRVKATTAAAVITRDLMDEERIVPPCFFLVGCSFQLLSGDPLEVRNR
jgi:hypothetical protein